MSAYSVLNACIGSGLDAHHAGNDTCQRGRGGGYGNAD
jgi:hypothetical protein